MIAACASVQNGRRRALEIDWLAIGGGGAGYYDSTDTGSWGGAAGGAGGQTHGSDVWLPGSSRAVTIGAGASRADKTVRNGSSTTLQGYTAAKGGNGGPGKNTTSGAAGGGDATQGYAGGARYPSANNTGGGGGAGSAGQNAPDGTNAGRGGDGYLWLDGQYYGPGGGGGSRAGSVAPAGLGTYDNNGEGGRWDNGGNGGTVNKGGGGGGGGSASGYGRSDSGSGGSGIVCIRQRGTSLLLSYTGTYTTNVVGDFRFYYLKSSGTLTVASNL